MDEREQQRKIKHRLAMIRHAEEEVTGSVAPGEAPGSQGMMASKVSGIRAWS